MTSITTPVTSEITSSLIPPLPWSFSSSSPSPCSSPSFYSIETPQVFTTPNVDIVSGVINYITTTVNHLTTKIGTSESVTTATNYYISPIITSIKGKYCQGGQLNVSSSYTNNFFLLTFVSLLLLIVIVTKLTTIYRTTVCHFNCLLTKYSSLKKMCQSEKFSNQIISSSSSSTTSTLMLFSSSFSPVKRKKSNLPRNLISFCKFNSLNYLLLGVFLTFSLGPNVIRSQSNYREIEKKILDEIIGEGKGYDNRIRPTGNKSLVTQPSNPKHQPADGPCMVRVNIYLRSISKISDLDMEYSVQITFREQWVDERLQYSDMDGQIRFLTLTDPSKIWKPDLFFSNEKEGHFHDIIMPNVLLRIYPHGEVLYSIRLSLVLACPMDLKYYPLDKQTCMIRMASYGYTTEDLVFLWKEGDPVQVTTNLHLPRFTLQRIQTNYCTSKTNTGEYSCLRVDLTFKREFSYYLIQIYIPCCMLVIVSWVSFWLDPNAIPARVSLGVTTLLTMATQISGINASLPPVSYTKAIDVWTGVCLTFVFGALLEFALVNYASRSDAHRAAALHHQFGLRRWDADGNITDDGMPPAGYQLKPLLAPARSDLMRGQHQTTVGGYLTTNSPIDSRNFIKRWLSKFPTRSKRIDVISRIFFPLMFAMFNLVYWVTYLFRDELNDL